MSADRPGRTHRLTIRLTLAERQAVDRRAAACRLSSSAYVRRAALDARPKARRSAGERTALRRLDSLGLALDELILLARRRDQPVIEDAVIEVRKSVRDAISEVAAVIREQRR